MQEPQAWHKNRRVGVHNAILTPSLEQTSGRALPDRREMGSTPEAKDKEPSLAVESCERGSGG